jgi:hypothetical protein
MTAGRQASAPECTPNLLFRRGRPETKTCREIRHCSVTDARRRGRTLRIIKDPRRRLTGDLAKRAGHLRRGTTDLKRIAIIRGSARRIQPLQCLLGNPPARSIRKPLHTTMRSGSSNRHRTKYLRSHSLPPAPHRQPKAQSDSSTQQNLTGASLSAPSHRFNAGGAGRRPPRGRGLPQRPALPAPSAQPPWGRCPPRRSAAGSTRASRRAP